MAQPVYVKDILDGTSTGAIRKNRLRNTTTAQPTNTENILRGVANSGSVRRNSLRETTMTQLTYTENIVRRIANTGAVRKKYHGEKFSDRYLKKHTLGRGTFGKVRLAIEKETGREVAIRIINKAKLEALDSLVQIMGSMKHSHIIQLYEIFENRQKLVLIMEYAIGGELSYYVKAGGVGENEARRIFRQIASAIYYCHTRKICHRNIKLKNVLLDEYGNAKISNFGFSNVFSGQLLLTTFCGTPLYASPEIVSGTPYRGPEVDCWSLGILLYTLVYGVMPFYEQSFHALAKKIAAGNYTEPNPPSSASPLIKEMLTVCPENRATIEIICKHPWMNIGYTTSCLHLAQKLLIDCPVRIRTLTYEESDEMGISTNPKFGLDSDSIHQQSEVVDEQSNISDFINWCRKKLRSARKMVGRMCMCLRKSQFGSQSYPVSPDADASKCELKSIRFLTDENPTDIRTSTMPASSLELKSYNEKICKSVFVEPTVVETAL